MKTITLSEEAYERLKSWKDGSDSFSAVVLRVVPKRGTAADLRAAFLVIDQLGAEHGPRVQGALRKENTP